MSESDEYQTPIDFFNILDKEFHFDLDPCTTKNNPLKTKYFYTKKFNGLIYNWDIYDTKNIFVNPPYSEIGAWIKKGYKESLKSCNIVFLIMVDTSCSYWHDYIFKYAKQIRFIRGRIAFTFNGKERKNNFHASAVVIFSNNLTYKNKIIFYNKSINKFLNPILSDDEIDEIVEGIINE